MTRRFANVTAGIDANSRRIIRIPLPSITASCEPDSIVITIKVCSATMIIQIAIVWRSLMMSPLRLRSANPRNV